MQDFKILILAYLIGHSPVETQTTFELEGHYMNMDECRQELEVKLPDGRYEVINDFVIQGDFKWDWLVAGCKNDQTGEEFRIEPTYPKGKPKELEGLSFTEDRLEV